MRRERMDIVYIALLLAIGLIVIAILFLLKIEIPRRDSERYINELTAETRLLSQYKTVVVNDTVAWATLYRDDRGETRVKYETAQAQPASATGKQVQAVDVSVHDDAVALVDATMTYASATRKPGQLMTADECQQYKVLGGDRDRRQAAVKYLCSGYDVEAESGKGSGNGVFYRANNGDLSRLILDLAIKGRLPYPNQKQSTAV